MLWMKSLGNSYASLPHRMRGGVGRATVGPTMALGTVPCRLACAASLVLFFLLAAAPARAGLKIRPVFIGGEPPSTEDMVGGGNLQEIFQVAAEAWEEVFKGGSGNWDVTIEFGWAPLGL